MEPVHQFRKEMDYNYPELWEVAQRIEGLVCRVGEHAGGVIFVDEPFTNSTALMKVPNGDVVTQFDLHDCEKASLIKIDLLSVEALDKIHNCLDLLVENKLIEPEATLRETYEKTIGIYKLERDDPKMWEMIWKHEIPSLFQMEQKSGIQGIDLIKPKNVNDLAVLNSVIRLMASEKGGELPLVLWSRYRNDISLWYQEMVAHGLTPEEIRWLSKHSAVTDGICESQEGLMSLVQEERLGGNSLTFADKCRKGIAKKQGSLFEECEHIYYDNIEKKGCSQKLAHYVWDVLLKVQRGYSFNRSHCLAYSLVALQEMNLCYKFPILFWNTACLISDSGGEEGSTSYDKIAAAIGKLRKSGIKVGLPNINKSLNKFEPDLENNQILYGLKGMLNISDEFIEQIINNRPYVSPKDFLVKNSNTKRNQMISLIKGGTFDDLIDRKECMVWYIWETCDKKSKLNLQNLLGLMKYKLMPEDTEEQIMARKVFEFTRYLKAITIPANKNKPYYVLDERALAFLVSIQQEQIICKNGDIYCILKDDWDKIYQKHIAVYRQWIIDHQVELLDKYNKLIFMDDWNKYARGTISAWEMEVLCFYYHDHELAKINNYAYGFSNFYDLPPEPEVERTFTKGGKEIKIYKLAKICGTCIAKNKNKATVTLLTTDGVVDVKFRKEYWALFDSQISAKGADGKKHVLEKSWFNRGSMIIVQGMRSEDNFIAKKYANSGSEHQLYKIDEVIDDEIRIRTTRAQGDSTEDEEE